MSAFEWTMVALVFLGLVVPAWLFAVAVFIAAKRPRRIEPSDRYFAYVRLLNAINFGPGGDFKIENGPAWTATVRELREYAEYADITVLYLEEITVTGSAKFDGVLAAELKATEAYLLGQRK